MAIARQYRGAEGLHAVLKVLQGHPNGQRIVLAQVHSL